MLEISNLVNAGVKVMEQSINLHVDIEGNVDIKL